MRPTALHPPALGLSSDPNKLTPPIRFAAYGEDKAFFVSTGVNALYIVYGGLILYPRMLRADTSVTLEMTRLPKVLYRLVDSRLCVWMGD